MLLPGGLSSLILGFGKSALRLAGSTTFGRGSLAESLTRIGRRFARWLYIYSVTIVDVEGFRLRVPTEFAQLVRRGYEDYTTRLFRETVREGSCVVDVGAHIGLYTLLASRGAGSTGRVYAFEPAPVNFHILLANLKTNNSRNVTAYNVALLDREGPVKLVLGTSTGWNSLFKHPMVQSSLGTVTVAGARGDSILLGAGIERVDVVKIDVEGAEVLVLRGLERILEQSPHCVLFIELNPACLRSAGFSEVELLSELARQGFQAQVIDEDMKRLVPLTLGLINEALERDPYWYCNLYCRRR